MCALSFCLPLTSASLRLCTDVAKANCPDPPQQYTGTRPQLPPLPALARTSGGGGPRRGWRIEWHDSCEPRVQHVRGEVSRLEAC
mmetsp:Transcript_67780/g.141319  ORF Transcript_67780/g.141319 Transcript_67780/m.141319 type:complete len:85 (-) Transcript_67780:279-533(-)